MKGCTSEWLLLDTGGVIVSPSADLPLNGGLSAGSHVKAHAALFCLEEGYAADYGTGVAALEHKDIVNFFTSPWIVRAETCRPYRDNQGGSGR